MKRNALQFAMLLLVGVAAGAGAQISDPSEMVSPPPRPHGPRVRAHELQSGKLQWMWQYTQPVPNGSAVALEGDERFATLIQESFRQPQAFWGKDVPISAVIPRFLSGHPAVNEKSNRYITVDGCVPSFCAAHGMLWIDLGTAQPTMVFAAVQWSTEGHTTDEASADYNLWLFSNRDMPADGLPLALTQAMSDWDARLATARRGVPHITHAILVEPNGHPFPLNPLMVGANTLPPQPDTVTPREPEE